MQKKQFLFIDEGTSALDEPTRTMIENKLLERKDLTIIITHVGEKTHGFNLEDASPLLYFL
ncbi:hypothetical protein SAMN04487834_107411 [Sharpea azabuensis]|uniref:Uncharacterized protein n=1 Tax=Sharpea azabuensis TaxID=322505 RepID=A0A1H6WV55_9FIRM|nr:hypothetical protein SAMN04487834_107411 [Sharpea azabuensis]